LKAGFACFTFAGLALALSSCIAAPLISPVRTAASGSLRESDNKSATGIQRKLSDHWQKDASLRRLRPSVSITNDISTFFSNRYIIVVGGYVASPEDRDRAIVGIPAVLGLDRQSMVIQNLIKVEPSDQSEPGSLEK
jgi:hypothetical protein